MRHWWIAPVLLCGSPMLGMAAEPAPDIVSPLTLFSEESSVENPAAPLNGKVETVLWRRIAIQRSPAGENREVTIESRLTKYDTENRAIEESDPEEDETRTTNTYKNGLLVSRRSGTSKAGGKQAGEELWSTYQYDDAGRLLDFQSGLGQKLENRFASRYDASGRLMQREVHLGANDALLYAEEFLYKGEPATVERRVLTPGAAARDAAKYRLDDYGAVVELWIPGEYHVSWKYDTQHRVIEQSTGPYAVPNGCDQCPLPGIIRTRYEDGKREQTFFEPGGNAIFQRVTQMERDGSIASIRYEAPSAPHVQDFSGAFRFVASIVPIGSERYVTSAWDDRGNWTEKREYIRPRTGPAVLESIYRRTIHYR